MENYHETPDKYNQLLWDYLKLINKDGKRPKKPEGLFNPESNLELLRWILRAIMKNTPEGITAKCILQFKPNSAHCAIQLWNTSGTEPKIIDRFVQECEEELDATFDVCVAYILENQPK